MKKAMLILITLMALFIFIGCETDMDESDALAKIEAAQEQVELPETVIQNLTLDFPLVIDAVTITWTTSTPSVITDIGEVTLPLAQGQQIVIVTATFSYEGIVREKDYTIRVVQQGVKHLQTIADSIDIPADVFSPIQLSFPQTIEGVELVWNSTNVERINHEGQVTLPNETGSVPVIINVTLNYGTEQLHKDFTIMVRNELPLHFPETVALIGYTESQVYTGVIENEVPKPSVPNCFPGAWYRKAVSSKDAWLGIEGIITLPDVELSEERFSTQLNRYLDNASIYLGGNAGAETDVGLIWERGCSDGTCTTPTGTEERIAFRPFWRYIHAGQNTYAHENYRLPQYYYLPGDTLRISVFSPRPGYLQMEIEVIAMTTIPAYVNLRASWRIEGNRPSNFVSPEFPSIGHGGSNAEFKRVNAIDQVGNEGRPAQATDAQVMEAVWHEMYLYRNIADEMRKVPFTTQRFASMICPNPDAFTVSYDGVNGNIGGEIISIHPATAN